MQDFEKCTQVQKIHKFKVNLPAMSFELEITDVSNIPEEIHKKVDELIILSLLLNANIFEKK